MSNEKLFGEVVSYLAYQDDFTFMFLMKMHKIADDSIGTMGVYVQDTRLFLRYSPSFMEKLTKASLRYVLMHEVGHVALLHCTHRCSTDKRLRKMENIAMDLAINSLLPDNAEVAIPRYAEDVLDEEGNILCKKDDRMGVFPDMYEFPECLSFEQYMALLKEKFPEGVPEDDAPSRGMDGEGEGAFDSHEGHGEDVDVAAMVREAVSKIQKSGKGWGTLPGSMKGAIEKAHKTEVPWWRVLRVILGNLVAFDREPTRRKPHRRLGYPYCGEVTSYIGESFCYVDTSASVGDKALSRFGAELEKLCDQIPVWLIMFDTAIQGKPVLFHQKKFKALKFEGRGGTSFQVVIDDAIKRRAKQVIIMTDGECSIPTIPPGMFVLWVITPDGNKDTSAFPGRVVHMKSPL